MSEVTMRYEELRRIDVGSFVEKKNGLSYLSWAWAVDQLLLRDATATWGYQWFDTPEGPKPYLKTFDTYMVFCSVKAFGVERTVQLPIFDYKNKPIANPTSMDLNTTMMRCLAKAISLHGIGINIYAGEDVPLATQDAAEGYINDMHQASSLEELEEITQPAREFVAQYPKYKEAIKTAYDRATARFSGGLKVVNSSGTAKGVAGLKQALNKE